MLICSAMRYQAKYVYDGDGGDELFETNGGLGLIGAGVSGGAWIRSKNLG
jgi:hypothetical protein